MFHTGEYVVSSTNGICRIEDVVKQDWSGVKKEYFMLVPVQEKNAKVYIPVEKAEERVRRVMKKNEALEFIRGMDSIAELRVDNEKTREKEYRQAVYSGDITKLVGVIKNIYTNKQNRLVQGKKMTAVDERYFKLAVHVLNSELAFVMDCREEDVNEIIKSNIEHANVMQDTE